MYISNKNSDLKVFCYRERPCTTWCLLFSMSILTHAGFNFSFEQTKCFVFKVAMDTHAARNFSHHAQQTDYGFEIRRRGHNCHSVKNIVFIFPFNCL